mmetsp:Transcript_1190/g.4203  ORF Transcript_1190/g.4203 Transcript_1190/m.4203 type:complete len:278 (+) Transcript_1190:190-1023(+)
MDKVQGGSHQMTDTLKPGIGGDGALSFPDLGEDVAVPEPTKLDETPVEEGASHPAKKTEVVDPAAANNSALEGGNTEKPSEAKPSTFVKTIQELEEDFPAASRHFYELLNEMVTSVAVEAQRMQIQGLAGEASKSACFAKPPTLDGAASGQAPGRPFEGVNSSKVFVDLYGQKMTGVGNEQIDCPNCKRKVVASRYAPHLEKCMGKSRRTRRQGDATGHTVGFSQGQFPTFNPFGGATGQPDMPSRQASQTSYQSFGAAELPTLGDDFGGSSPQLLF